MIKLKIISLMLFILVLIGFPHPSHGFDLLSNIKEFVNTGNNIGVMECAKQNMEEKSGLHDGLVKRKCVEKHQRLIDIPLSVTGNYYEYCKTLGYQPPNCDVSYVRFSGGVKNLSKDKIITSINGYIIRKQGKDYFDESNLWVLPNESQDISFHINRDIVSVETLRMSKVDDGVGLKTEIKEVNGLSFSMN
jgi:hypothetical protein